jgi:hypothetical protein
MKTTGGDIQIPPCAADGMVHVNYNRIQGREFKPIGRRGLQAAERLLKAGMRAYRQ